MSWSRILPDGFKSSLNLEGIKYYKTLINDLLSNDIQPVVTMYHYDLPQNIQNLGGLTNPLFVEYFYDYAKVLFENFGDQVRVHSYILVIL